MRISSLEAWTVAYTEPNDHNSTRYVSLCRLVADDGTVGWGEGVTLIEEAARATTGILRAWAPLVVGLDATPVRLAAFVQERSWWYGTGGGISGFAAAALDTAAWDVHTRRSGVRLVDALGGPAHDDLPIIVTSHATLPDVVEQAKLFGSWADDVSAAGVKVGFGKAGGAHLGFDHDRDLSFVAALREALGDTRRIMIDISPRVRWSAPEAIRRVRGFEEYGLDWIEEPLGADDPAGYARLQAATSTLIAYGEREWDLRGMVRILDTGTVDVLGIDAGRTGVTAFVAAAAHAHSMRRQVNAHAFAGPVSYAAGLACALTSVNSLQFEVPAVRNSLTAALAPDLPLPKDGRLGTLTEPGLGIEIDPAAVRAIAVD